jgi:hypothetical protein
MSPVACVMSNFNILPELVVYNYQILVFVSCHIISVRFSAADVKEYLWKR